MLPSLGAGWAAVPGDAPKSFRFEVSWNREPGVASASADSDQVRIDLPDGDVLEIQLDLFGHLFSTLMIAAHSRPAD